MNGARVSFNQESDELTERDEGLIRFLMRERHGSPFEHGYFRFVVKAPLFVVREHHRHRAGHCLPGSAEIWLEVIADDEQRRLDDEAEVAVLERAAVPLAHQEADQALVARGHLVRFLVERDAGAVHDREVGGARGVEGDEPVVEDGDGVLSLSLRA